MSKYLYVGIDPGAKLVAIAFIEDPGKTNWVHALEYDHTKVGTRGFVKDITDVISEVAARRQVSHYRVRICIEDVALYTKTTKGESITSFASYLSSKYLLEGACLAKGWPVHTVRANVWKRKMEVTKVKKTSVHRASMLHPSASYTFFPNVKNGHNKAEACLLAHYGKNFPQW